MNRGQIFDDFFEREGGWGVITDLPSDLGGLTKSGITMALYNAWLVTLGLDPLSDEDFVKLSKGQAEAFLQAQFMAPFLFVESDELLFVSLTDFAMNAGPDDATKALQAALKVRDYYRGAVDGKIGPATRTAWLMAKNHPDVVADVRADVVQFRVLFHVTRALDAPARAFMAENPATQLHNLKGWVRRALEFL